MAVHNIRNAFFGAALVALATTGCKKEESATPEAVTDEPTEMAEPAALEPAEPAPATDIVEADLPEGDYILVEASHAEPKPNDPVKILFPSYKVVSADFENPEDLTGGKAELEIDIGSLQSGVPKRDDHLKSTDYFDIAGHPTATVVVTDVVKKGEAMYSATAKVSVHGETVAWPVDFEVVGEHRRQRHRQGNQRLQADRV